VPVAPAAVESASGPVVGVLALQGDVREHSTALVRVGARPVPVRRPAELARVDGLVIPGGESTTIDRLLRTFDLAEPVRARIDAGMPVLGSCAGMILLADRLTDRAPDQQTLGGIDMTVRRNAFGRQVDSFETELDLAGVEGGRVRAVFIRAPQVVEAGPEVEVLARVGDTIVAVRQGPLVATAFHPEIAGDDRVHGFFVDLVCRPGGGRVPSAPGSAAQGKDT
jgi:5'-phosphate synthase pdxT subunit